MKKKIISRIAVLMLTASIPFALASCGGSDSSSKTGSDSTASVPADNSAAESTAADGNGAVSGETKTWGIYTFLLPEGWTLRGGDVFNDNDETVCSVKKSDFSYFELKCETEEVQQKQYNYNKKTYTLNQKDLSAATIAGIEWNGFEYGNELNKGFELYGSTGGRFLRVSSVGFAFDSAEAKAVLGSLKVTEAAPADSSSAEESAPEAVSVPEENSQAGEPVEQTFDGKATFAYNGVYFSVGDKMSTIKDQLGNEAKPSATMTPCAEGAQDVSLYYYPGLTIQVNFEDTIISVTASEEDAPGKDAALVCGLKVGDSRETAKSLLGTPDDENDYGLSYKEGTKTLQVFYNDGTINLISSMDTALPF